MSSKDRSLESAERVFEAIRQTLYKYPDLRVGQIIANAVSAATRGSTDPFYFENDDLAKAINGERGDAPDERKPQPPTATSQAAQATLVEAGLTCNASDEMVGLMRQVMHDDHLMAWLHTINVALGYVTPLYVIGVQKQPEIVEALLQRLAHVEHS